MYIRRKLKGQLFFLKKLAPDVLAKAYPMPIIN
jgi:hypothetical protein